MIPQESGTPASAATQLWQAMLDRLATSTDPSELAVVLALVGEMEAEALPIAELTHMYLRLAQHTDAEASISLFIPDVEEDVLAPCRDLLTCALDRVPLDAVVAAVRAVYAPVDGDDDAQEHILTLLQRWEECEIDLSPFLTLLQDPVPSIRCGGLEALFQLGRADGMVELLHDPAPQVRRLAIENLGYLVRLPVRLVQELADTDPDAAVRAMATHWLTKTE